MVDTGGRRRKGQRLLYYFRTPPAIRVGREAFDADAIRLLEQHNPEVSFDWARLLKASAQAGPTGPQGAHPSQGLRDDRRQRRDRRDQSRPRHGSGVAAAPPARDFTPANNGAVEAVDAQAAADVTEYSEYTEYIELGADGPADAPSFSRQETAEPADSIESVEPAESPDPRGFDASGPAEPDASPPEPAERHEPLAERYARLGSEGLGRLRSRYADLSGRLAARQMDEGERVEMMARAERLNPDRWLTAEEVAAALEEYETVFESLRGAIGRPPRRGRL